MPPIHFWFSGTALYLAGSFAFAIVVGLIGIKEMIPRRLFYILIAVAIVLSGMAWFIAAKQERNSDDQVTKIDALLKSVGKIAGAAKIDPNQSAQALADQIINKLSAIQNQVDQTNSHVTALEHPAPDPLVIYQFDKPVANVIRGKFTEDRSRILFIELDNVSIDFNQNVMFRNSILHCNSRPGLFMFGNSPITGRPAQSVFTDVECDVVKINP